jgi:hypothetical protein
VAKKPAEQVRESDVSDTVIPTMSLRIVKRERRVRKEGPYFIVETVEVLQQAVRKPGSDALIWRDVPIVRERPSSQSGCSK